MRENIKRLVQSTLPELSKRLACDIPKDFSYEVEIPKNKTFGDFSINLALKLSKITGQKPREIAAAETAIIESIRRQHPKDAPWIQSIRVEGPGFINFFLNETSRGGILQTIQRDNEKFGRSDFGQGQKVIVEFVSANPTGPLTIAHGRQAAVGDTLANILSAAGYRAHKEFYLNDAGRQVELLAKSVWARLKQTEVPEDGYHGHYIMDLAKEAASIIKRHKQESDAADDVKNFAVQKMLQQIQEDLKKIKVEFNEYFKESSLYQKSIDGALSKLKAADHVFEAEGALWFRSTAFGDDKDRVLKRGTGEYTYFAPDIAYHESKFTRGFDLLINLWGPDHHGYIARVKAACAALGHSPDQLKVLIVQLVTLYRRGEQVRMSKRAGEYVTLRELIDEVGADATRFFFLMRRVESPLDFDLELAKEKSQDNPVYYLQYAHARICSMVEFSKRTPNVNADVSCLSEKEEVALLQWLAEYPEVIKQAARSLEPYRVVDYLRELAASFHSFYGACRVVSDDEMLTSARLLLTDCVRIVLRNGLQLLGISQPTSM